MPIAEIESLDREGRGVARFEGKTVFVDGAAPGEIVEYSSYRKKSAWEAARIVSIGKEGSARTSPHCAFFGTCGGCSMQHIEVRTQVAAKQRVPQIEVAVGEEAIALVLRILTLPSADDEDQLKRFAMQHGVQLWLQPAGPDSVRAFWPLDAPPLYYALPEYRVRIAFGPTDFIQVNHAVNRLLVRRALSLLDPRPGEKVTDFFCGVGNFTLPIARCGADVLGVEGSALLLARARDNADSNELACRFETANLSDAAACARLPACDKALLDPPREGAIELVKSFAPRPPRRIVYVSCDPATLARDSAVLIHVQGYRLTAAGVVNMFPHTSHVESIALFER